MCGARGVGSSPTVRCHDVFLRFTAKVRRRKRGRWWPLEALRPASPLPAGLALAATTPSHPTTPLVAGGGRQPQPPRRLVVVGPFPRGPTSQPPPRRPPTPRRASFRTGSASAALRRFLRTGRRRRLLARAGRLEEGLQERSERRRLRQRPLQQHPARGPPSWLLLPGLRRRRCPALERLDLFQQALQPATDVLEWPPRSQAHGQSIGLVPRAAAATACPCGLAGCTAPTSAAWTPLASPAPSSPPRRSPGPWPPAVAPWNRGHPRSPRRPRGCSTRSIGLQARLATGGAQCPPRHLHYVTALLSWQLGQLLSEPLDARGQGWPRWPLNPRLPRPDESVVNDDPQAVFEDAPQGADGWVALPEFNLREVLGAEAALLGQLLLRPASLAFA